MSFTTAIQRGGMVTVMNAAVISLADIDYSKYADEGAAYEALTTVAKSGIKCYIDHFKTANLNASGPTITITGGQDANPLIKFGKTMKCEMQMALCQIDALEELGGVETVNNGTTQKVLTLGRGDTVKAKDIVLMQKALAKPTAEVKFVNKTTYEPLTKTIPVNGGASPVYYDKNFAETETPANELYIGVAIPEGSADSYIDLDDADKAFTFTVVRPAEKSVTGYKAYTVTNRFPGPVAIIGDTFIVDQASGDQVPVKIVIYSFLPDAVFNLTQDASNAATFDLNGDVLGVHFKNTAGNAYHGTSFYTIINPDEYAAATSDLQSGIDDKKAEYKALA